jgi:two-component system, LuxR family, sensor kinase FixL
MREAMDKASEQALRAGHIIRRLRDFVARGESERRVESLKKLVEEASALALVGIKDQGVRVRFDFDPLVDLVLADKVQIQQVILNLMRNAIEAMSQATERKLTIATTLEEGMVRTDVSDTGPGLDPSAHSDLFVPFTSTKPTGLGVGLSISRSIIEAHYGTIWAEDNPGGGARFSFTMPLARLESSGD